MYLNFTLPLILLTNFSSVECPAETLECGLCVRPSVRPFFSECDYKER
jgi:hypothetical protein